MTDDAGDVPLARLFAMAFRYLVDSLHERLQERGWDDVRPAFGFALLATRHAPMTVTELAALMGTTKQAASKLAGTMLEAGYLEQAVGTEDGRQRPLRLSPRGRDLLADVEVIYVELEGEWASVIGAAGLVRLRRDLRSALVASHGETCRRSGRRGEPRHTPRPVTGRPDRTVCRAAPSSLPGLPQRRPAGR